MIRSIPWSGNPRLYLRPYPAWYALYRELSRERLGRSEAAQLLGIEEKFISDRQKIPGLLHRDKTRYSLLDLIVLSIISDYGHDPGKVEFFGRMINDYEELLWQSLIAVVQGRETFIAMDFDKTLVAPYVEVGKTDPGDLDVGEEPIHLNPHFKRVLVDHSWPEFAAEITDGGHWSFLFKGRGYLQLETLALDENCAETRPADSDGQARKDGRDEHGHKHLTSANHLEVDSFFRCLAWWTDDVSERDRRVKGRIDEILAIKMHPSVPSETRKMFDMLKGAIVYGFYYRPLFSLMGDQVYFVADAALYHKCKLLGIEEPEALSFKERIEVLETMGIIHSDESFLWNAKRRLRNSIAHRTEQSLDWPPNEIAGLQLIADDVSRLFMPLFGNKRH